MKSIWILRDLWLTSNLKMGFCSKLDFALIKWLIERKTMQKLNEILRIQHLALLKKHLMSVSIVILFFAMSKSTFELLACLYFFHTLLRIIISVGSFLPLTKLSSQIRSILWPKCQILCPSSVINFAHKSFRNKFGFHLAFLSPFNCSLNK